jgi:signal transduction histidine kinase
MKSIQFTQEDILTNFKKFSSKNKDTKFYELNFVEKELRSSLKDAINLINEFSESDQINLHQRAYSQYVKEICKKANSSISKLSLTLIEDRLDSKRLHELKKESKTVAKKIKELREYSPVLSKISEIGELSTTDINKLKGIEFLIEEAVYKYNLQFAKQFNREKYFLKSDINSYWIKNFSENAQTIGLDTPGTDRILANTDYMTQAIIPILDIIKKQSFDKTNDSTKKIDKTYAKYTGISSKLNTESESIIIRIWDNGTGIIEPNTETIKTLEDITTLIDSKNGLFTYETNLGQGTEFDIRLPYTVKQLGTKTIYNIE